MSEEQTRSETEFLIRQLRLQKGMHVLDVPCAEGRLALPLASKGINVIGVDISERAHAMPVDSQLPFTRLKADMRQLEWSSHFDAAYCMGNSFGYFDRADTLKFLHSVRKALKPAGNFILETALSAEILFTIGGTKEWVEADGTIMLMENQFDPRHNRLDSRFLFLKGGMTEEHDTQHYIFTAGEVCSMLEESNFSVEHLFGSFDSLPFELGSEHLIIVATAAD